MFIRALRIFALLCVSTASCFVGALTPLALEECEKSLLTAQEYLWYEDSLWHWVDYGQAQLTVRHNLTGPNQVILREGNNRFEVTNPEQRKVLSNYFFTHTAPKGTTAVLIDYPKIGQGLAYRTPKEENLYVKNLKADSGGVIQVPGLPPIYERQINGKTYVDIPHPDVFNAYLGRDFFMPYSSNHNSRFAGEIPSGVYANIASYDRFPLAVVNVELATLTHDTIGHALMMALLHDHTVWTRTVSVLKRAIAIRNAIGKKKMGPSRAQDYETDSKLIMNWLLTAWEGAVNGSGISGARTEQEVKSILGKVEAELEPAIVNAENEVDAMEGEFAKIPFESPR